MAVSRSPDSHSPVPRSPAPHPAHRPPSRALTCVPAPLAQPCRQRRPLRGHGGRGHGGSAELAGRPPSAGAGVRLEWGGTIPAPVACRLPRGCGGARGRPGLPGSPQRCDGRQRLGAQGQAPSALIRQGKALAPDSRAPEPRPGAAPWDRELWAPRQLGGGAAGPPPVEPSPGGGPQPGAREGEQVFWHPPSWPSLGSFPSRFLSGEQEAVGICAPWGPAHRGPGARDRGSAPAHHPLSALMGAQAPWPSARYLQMGRAVASRGGAVGWGRGWGRGVQDPPWSTLQATPQVCPAAHCPPNLCLGPSCSHCRQTR